LFAKVTSPITVSAPSFGIWMASCMSPPTANRLNVDEGDIGMVAVTALWNPWP